MNTSVRYVLRHMGRGGGKTVLAVFLALLLTAAVGRLDTLRQHYEALSRSVIVQGSVLGGLTLYRAETLAEAEEVKDYYLEEVLQGCEIILEDNNRPSAVTFMLCFTSNYTRDCGDEVEWLEGWDRERFQNSTSRVCLMSKELADLVKTELGGGELGLGGRFHIGENGYGYVVNMQFPEILDPDKLIEIYKQRRPVTTVVGLVDVENKADRLWLPIHAMSVYQNDFPTLRVEYATYTLRDYRDAQPFRERFLAETAKQQGNPSLYLDTAEADRIRKMANLLSTLYPIALGVALLLGGVLPGLMVLQNSRETAILRVLGMSRKRVCAMLTGEQLFLCILGLVLGAVAAFLLGAGWELIYPAIHLAACLLGSILFAWVSTGKDLLSLLQAKE